MIARQTAYGLPSLARPAVAGSLRRPVLLSSDNLVVARPAGPRLAPLRRHLEEPGQLLRVASPSRSSAGSIAASGTSPGRRPPRGVTQPILGWLHCGPCVYHGWTTSFRSPGRSSVGSIAVSGTGHSPACTARRHSAGPRPTPLRLRHVVRVPAHHIWHPAGSRPTPLRLYPLTMPVNRYRCHPTDLRLAPLRQHPVEQGVTRIEVIQPILGRLHCGRDWLQQFQKLEGRHPADPRLALLRHRDPRLQQLREWGGVPPSPAGRAAGLAG